MFEPGPCESHGPLNVCRLLPSLLTGRRMDEAPCFRTDGAAVAQRAARMPPSDVDSQSARSVALLLRRRLHCGPEPDFLHVRIRKKSEKKTGFYLGSIDT